MKEPFIDMRLWRQFAAVAEELHFGRAAQRLHMTQPPLTQAIAGLERTLGLQLFDRTKRSVQLTPAGAALLPQVLDLLDRAQALPAQARAAAAGEVGRLRLAFVSTVGFGMLPQWVRAFRAQWPGVRLELIEATGDVQLQALARGEIDAGLLLHTPGQAPPALQSLCVAQEPLVLALPEHHPLARTPTVRFSDLLREPLVIFPRPILPSLYDAIVALYHAAGQVPQVAQEAIQMQTIVNLVSADLGLAWVPASVQQFQRPGVVYRELGGKSPLAPVCETSLVWGAAVPPALARWIDFVAHEVQASALKG
jgi:DNA-binding transcriptional LysR family regulator